MAAALLSPRSEQTSNPLHPNDVPATASLQCLRTKKHVLASCGTPKTDSETEEDFARSDGNRGVILDMVARERERAGYDTEAQIDPIKAPMGRAVLHMDTLGVTVLKAQEDPANNPEVWVIFICKTDATHTGKLLYHEKMGQVFGSNRYYCLR